MISLYEQFQCIALELLTFRLFLAFCYYVLYIHEHSYTQILASKEISFFGYTSYSAFVITIIYFPKEMVLLCYLTDLLKPRVKVNRMSIPYTDTITQVGSQRQT